MPSASAFRHIRRIALVVGCAALAVVAAATLSPLDLRPESSLPVDVERGLAFAVVSFALALASPRRPLRMLALIIACAAVLECLQNVLPDRHGRIDDFIVKMVGAAIGMVFGAAANRVIKHVTTSDS